MSVVNSTPLLLGDEGYQISRSVRLRSSASAYFNRTPGSTTNQTTDTLSIWVKRGTLGVDQAFYAGRTSTNFPAFDIRFTSADLLWITQYTTGAAIQFQLITSQVFRDPSSWYHIVIAFDTTQATASNRIKVYVNNSQITAFGTATYPSQNLAVNVNTTNAQYLGAAPANSIYFDGYLTEVNFIDGQALTPTSFGETDALTGVWKPKKYTGTYGTNGFYLNFADNSSNTATTIGKDSSGNGNNWTPNNISVTAGATYDSMLDVPTLWADGGNGRGNYATLNPLRNSMTLSNANLTFAATGNPASVGTIGVTSGKWYWEISPTSSSPFLGIIDSNSSTALQLPSTANAWCYYGVNGFKYSAPSGSGAYGAAYGNGDVIGVGFDADAGTLVFYKNNVSQGTAYTGLTNGPYFPAVSSDQSGTAATGSINFGQRPFTYTPPSGFKALNTQNLPDATITKGNKHFDVSLYTGNGSTQSISNSGAFQPDLVWVKIRNNAGNHVLSDSIRGTTKQLFSSLTDAEQTRSDYITAFDTSGFSVGAGSAGTGNVNSSGGTFVGWQWKAGGTAVSNTAGSITSQVSANTTAGFSVVTYTGTGANATVGHGLGVAPRMVIVKARNGGPTTWLVYHQAIAATNPGAWYLSLESTNARASLANVWNNTDATSSVFSIGSNASSGANAVNYVAYCFSEVAGFSKFGSYTGNGSANGPFVFTNFQPRFVMAKRIDSADGWYMLDTARNTYNAINAALYASSSGAEFTTADRIDALSNGFKLRVSAGPNVSGGTYIFMAFASNPFKNSLAR